jgi:hypothetical protein
MTDETDVLPGMLDLLIDLKADDNIKKVKIER